MNNTVQEIGAMSKTKVLRDLAALTIFLVLSATSGLARQMECSYDYSTHVTTLKLDDLGEANASISYSFVHSISPTGGEEMFLFSESDPALLEGTGRLEFIMEKLFVDPLATISAIEFVDFDRPTLKQLQAPSTYLEQSGSIISAPLVIWSCHRTD